MNQSEASKTSGLSFLLGRTLATAFRVLAKSWRTRGEGQIRAKLDQHQGQPLLFGFWHGKYIPLFGALRGLSASVFVGQGFRGQLIMEICTDFGFTPVLLPHHKRPEAIERMRNALQGPIACASAFDGALGPPRQVKPTLVRLASDSGATILPLSMSAKPCVVLPWRWDHREIPLPFASVELRIGEPIRVPRELNDAEMSDWCERLRSALDELEEPSDSKALRDKSRIGRG